MWHPVSRWKAWLTVLAENKLMSLPELEAVTFVAEDTAGVRSDLDEEAFKTAVKELQNKFQSVGVVFTAYEVKSLDSEVSPVVLWIFQKHGCLDVYVQILA